MEYTEYIIKLRIVVLTGSGSSLHVFLNSILFVLLKTALLFVAQGLLDTFFFW